MDEKPARWPPDVVDGSSAGGGSPVSVAGMLVVVEVAGPVGQAVSTPEGRYGATVGAVVAFLVAVAVVYLGGRPLKRRFDADVIEAVQSLVILAVAIAIGSLLIAVWGVWTEVRTALQVLSIGPAFGVKVLVTFAALVAAYTITRFTKRWIKSGAGPDAMTAHQREVAHHVVQALVFIPGILFVVALWGVPARDLFLGAGVLGIVLGFAARQTLSGVLSGFVILFARPFEVGDWIAVGDREGIVTEVTVFNTELRTFDEEHVLVPNDVITENEVVNYSKTPRLRLSTEVGVDYDCDVATAAATALEAMRDCDAVAGTPPPEVVRRGFGDSAVVLELRYWIDTPSIQRKWQAQNAVVESVKATFEAADIKIPYPQRELSGRTERGGLEVAATAVEPAADRGAVSDADGTQAPIDGAADGSPVARSGDGDPASTDGAEADDRSDPGQS